MQQRVSIEEYHRAPGLSYSGLKYFEVSPAHYKAYIGGEIERESAPIFSAAHLAILEPDKFNPILVEGRRKKADKEIIEAAEAAGQLVLRNVEYERIIKMRDAVRQHDIASALVGFGVNESSYFSDHELGFTVKCRPDILWQDKGIIADLKAFYDLRTFNLERHIAKMKYHWQAAWYEDIVMAAHGREFRFAHLFVEDKPPYGVRVVTLNEAALERARKDYFPLLPIYADCIREDRWPGYEQRIDDISLPNYAWGDNAD